MFGNQQQKQPQTGGQATEGFSFGISRQAPASTAGANTAPSFSFSQPSGAASASTGFSFPATANQTAAAPSAAAPSGAFSFSTPSATNTANNASTTGGTAGGISGFAFGPAAVPAAGETKKPTFSFGATAASNAAPASTTVPNFGGATSAGTVGQSSTAIPSAAGGTLSSSTLAKPSFSFGATQQPAAETAAKPTLPFGGGGGGGGAVPSAAAIPSFSLGGTAAPTSTSTAAANSGFSFALPSTPASKSTAAAAVAAAAETPATTAAQSPLTLSALKTPAAKTDAAQVAATPTPSFSFGPITPASTSQKQPPAAAPSALSTAAPKNETSGATAAKPTVQSTSTPAVSVKSAEILTSLRGKTMDDILTEWQTELQNSVALFHRKAADIARIDARLIENSDKIFKLVNETGAVQSTQSNLLSTLDYIESQQSQLDKELDQFEGKLQSVLSANPAQKKQTGMASPYSGLTAEEERERTYELAETLNAELSQMNQSINDTIETVNKLWKKTMPAVGTGKEGDQTMELMTKILNEHFNQLQWIDATTQQLGQRLVEVKRVAETVKWK